MEDNAQSMSTGGNGSIAQMTKPVSPDLEQLSQDFRRFIGYQFAYAAIWFVLGVLIFTFAF